MKKDKKDNEGNKGNSKNIFKKLVEAIGLYGTTRNVQVQDREVKSSGNDTIVGGIDIIQKEIVENVKEQAWFAKKNNLMEANIDPPIVYRGLSNKIFKEDQYGYVPEEGGPPATMDIEGDDEMVANDIDFISVRKGFVKPPAYIGTTANFQSAKEQFEERWKVIQEEHEENTRVSAIVREDSGLPDVKVEDEKKEISEGNSDTYNKSNEIEDGEVGKIEK